jgi:type I restriction enzyme, R subunit
MRQMTGEDGLVVLPGSAAVKVPPFGGLSGVGEFCAQSLDRVLQPLLPLKLRGTGTAYGFLSAVLPYSNAEWEKVSIFLNLLIPKLPAPTEEDLSKGILESIDMDSYRVEKKATLKIALADTDAEIEPAPAQGGSRKSEPGLDRLSNILKTFNEALGTLFTDADRVVNRIRHDIAPKVAADGACSPWRSDTQAARRVAAAAPPQPPRSSLSPSPPAAAD